MPGKIDRSNIKKYFKGSMGPVITMLIGLVTICWIIGLFILIAGIVWLIYEKMKLNKDVEKEIDDLISYEINQLKERGMQKLNVVDEQVNIIDPICLYGPSYDPNPSSDSESAVTRGIFRKLASSVTHDDRPVWLSKVGSDGKWRYSLIEINVFLFDKAQMFLYYAYLDITTGTVFHEGTYEYFYRDIVSVRTNQKHFKMYNTQKKQFVDRLFEYITIYTAGCSHKASISTDLNSSYIDTQFAAMRNLIRDKKNHSMHVS